MDMDRHILPFYMTYPAVGNGWPYNNQQEDTIMRDLEYLQQMYPEEAKRYQVRISQILDKIDYEGSMIYDEYPDKWQLYRLTDNILAILKQEAIEEAETLPETIPENSSEQWKQTADMIQILLFYEVYKRRHRRKRGLLKF